MLWPLVPNWSKGVKETLAFKTEVITSRSGKEQRRALRTTPRRTLAFQSLADGDRRRTLEAVLSASTDGSFQAPDFLRGVRTTAALPVSGTSVTVRSVPSWLVAGAQVALASRRQVQALTVDDVAGLTVTFTAGATLAATSASLLSPLVDGWLTDGARLSMASDSVAVADIDIDIQPGADAVNEGVIDYGWWFDGREVLSLKPNWVRAPTVTFTNTAEVVDYGRGRVARVAPVDFVTRVQQASYLRKTADNVEYLRQFFSRMKGQRGEFYAPTWLPDMTMAADAVAGTNTLTISGREVYDRYGSDTVHRTILLQAANGTMFARKISSIALSGANSVLTLSTNWAMGLAASEVRTISWMPLSRFASDTMTIEWVTDQVAQVLLSTRSLEAAVSEITGELDEVAAYMVSTYGWDFTETVLCDPLDYAVNTRWYAISQAAEPL